MTPSGLLLSDDLIFTSRILGAARDHGLLAVAAGAPELLLSIARKQQPACVVIDLANPGLNLPDLLAGLAALPRRPRVVAYGPHVDAAGLRAARDAGCDVVLPRSAFAERLAADLPAWFAGPEPT